MLDSGTQNTSGKIIIDHLNFGNILSLRKEQAKKEVYDNMFGFGGSGSLSSTVEINFQCDIGTVIEYTNLFSNSVSLPDVETLNSFADHALTLDSLIR